MTDPVSPTQVTGNAQGPLQGAMTAGESWGYEPERPKTVPFDFSYAKGSDDLPMDIAPLAKTASEVEPEQIHIALAGASHLVNQGQVDRQCHSGALKPCNLILQWCNVWSLQGGSVDSHRHVKMGKLWQWSCTYLLMFFPKYTVLAWLGCGRVCSGKRQGLHCWGCTFIQTFLAISCLEASAVWQQAGHALTGMHAC